jgi:MFS family permease
MGRFRSLRRYNFRTWAVGALISNIGTWMQRTAQDWLVLTQLTHNSAAAVGTVMALQYGPHLLLLPLTGFAADHFDRRKLLICTQTAMGVLALGLGLLTVTGFVRLWHVYIFALLLGCATAFDSPANQTFVTELVGEEDLTNAVALNSTSYNTARMTGPALAGVLIASLGTGWAFLVNAASFVAVVGALGMLRVEQLHRVRKASRAATGGLGDGFRYVWGRPDLQALLLMVLLIGTFGLNFPIYISTMAVSVFHVGPSTFGVITGIMGVGTIAGALLAAGREKQRFTVLIAGAGWFGLGCALAAITPDYWLFAFAMLLVGVAAVTFTNSSNSLVQLSTERAMRGRVMAIRLAIIMGGTPLGAPIAGWVADRFGPRWALAVGAASGVAAVAVGVVYLAKFRNLRVSVGAGRIRVSVDGT